VRDSAPALELLIENYQQWGQTEELIRAARELTQLQPDNQRAWGILIHSLKGAVRREMECLGAIRAALGRDLPEEVRHELHYQLAEQLLICGDGAGARREIDDLSLVDGDSFRVLALRVDLYRLEGHLDEALETMNRIFPQVRDPAAASLNRGIIYLDLGRYEDASRDLKRAIASQPMNAAAHFKLAAAYRGLGEVDQSMRHSEIAARIEEKRTRIGMLQNRIRRDPQNREIYEQLAELYDGLGDGESARQWEQRAAIVKRSAPDS
jgi:tetratricopeptide (TPR) repeat protein